MFNPFMRYSSYYNPWQGGRGYNNPWRGGRGFFNGRFPGGNGYMNPWQVGGGYTNNQGMYGYGFPQGGYGYNMPQGNYGYMNNRMQGGNGYNMPNGYGFMNGMQQGGNGYNMPQGYGFTNGMQQGGGFLNTPMQGVSGYTNTPMQGVNGYANTPVQGVSGFTNTQLQVGNADTNTLQQSGSGYANNETNIPGAGGPADNVAGRDIKLIDNGPGPFIVDIGEAAKQNDAFRKAIWTGDDLQVTLMSVNSGEDIGFEAHPDLDQFISIEEGSGIIVMGDKKENLDFHEIISAGGAFIIPAGKWHNLVNSSEKPLKLFSVYTKPLHPSGAVHATRADAKPAEDNKQEIVYVNNMAVKEKA